MKGIREIVCIVLVAVLLCSCGTGAQCPTTGQETTTVAENTVADTRYAAAQDRYSDHHLLDRIGIGNCVDLRGEIALVVIFVDEPGYVWEETDTKRGITETFRSETVLETAAASYGVELDLQPKFLHSSVPVGLDQLDYAAWTAAALKGAGLDRDTAAQTVCAESGTREAAFMLCINRPGRAYSINHTADIATEHSVLFEDLGGFAHELLHMYGAPDYYYPRELRDIFVSHLSESIMLNTQCTVVDSLTAYTVGWKKELRGSALAVVEESAWITQAFLAESYEKETVTGYGTREYSTCIYEGEMVKGIPNGKGVFTWNDGTRYEGDVVNARREGYGILTWPGGNRYEGEFANNQFHGEGTYYYADGTVRSGQWENGSYIG